MEYSRKDNLEFNPENFTKMWNEGYSIEDIAKKFKVPKVVVFRCAIMYIDDSSQRPLIDHKKFVELWNRNKSYEEIANFFCATVPYIIKYAKMHKNECPQNRKRAKIFDHERFDEMWKSGYSCEEIADFFEVSEQTVAGYARKHKELGPKRTSWRKKLTKNNHSRFVKMWNEGFYIDEIAKELGITEEQVEKYASEHENECS